MELNLHISKDGRGYWHIDTFCFIYIDKWNDWCFEYEATVVDKKTPINICNHTYWNLSGN